MTKTRKELTFSNYVVRNWGRLKTPVCVWKWIRSSQQREDVCQFNIKTLKLIVLDFTIREVQLHYRPDFIGLMS